MTRSAYILAAAILLFTGSAGAQGSIFGLVLNADMSIPGENEISFFGYLDNTDEEIRIESSIGAGFDEGNWYDDFQNYLTEAAGNPYDFHFFNAAINEGYVLSELIPNNSFQREDVFLASTAWPEVPGGVTGIAISYSEVTISWLQSADIAYHVYRREGSSEGSFFRIDDPSGSLANTGVSDSYFVDNTVDSGNVYHYLVIGMDVSGNFGPHSEIITVNVSAPSFICGDVNDDGLVNIGDCVYTMAFIFRGGPAPDPYESGDTNSDSLVNIGDIVYTLNYIFRGGPPPGC
jgi:hypothetical protein